ncbi:hypothetical protein ASPZODRAFT_71833 [Penicilliopsis zonata CBS 506.65]|uniref:Kinesin motor domain-containing protein n=1 Tax=Penicilliopsis zonata CBS 506.65 TaxID=1073090 RepID=A0A1L9SAX1_9EURO|nr:hypothetical protein ASPZODRAFT_71833 [Penicilliopsis zonata CBS 506.65]OJJ44298.1 hypothetical protein ASPZODRAFT_71833 [Penicilliopsis zonata CBS 506.65]
MSSSTKSPQTSLFQVFLRLRPPISPQPEGYGERYLTVEPPEVMENTDQDGQNVTTLHSTHITLQPPNDNRKRAVEKFAFTKVFEESASQLDVFEDMDIASLVNGVLLEKRDGLIATLGVTGSGKSHTILGSKSQRGITQMALDLMFKSIATGTTGSDVSTSPLLLASLAASDPSEAQLFSAQTFLEAVYGDPNSERNRGSRAQTPSSRSQTPMAVWTPLSPNILQETQYVCPPSPGTQAQALPMSPGDALHTGKEPYPASKDRSRLDSKDLLRERLGRATPGISAPFSHFYPSVIGSSLAKFRLKILKEPMPALIFPRRHMQKPSAMPRSPDVGHLAVDVDPKSEYIVLVSMYEVYNDRIFDLLSPSIIPGQGSALSRQGGNGQKDRRRPLLFKPTESSPDRKIVAGLRKVACTTYEEALAVLEVGLTERKVTGTGANSVSSRSHGFFCLEVKKKTTVKKTGEVTWTANTLTVADLAGSERARTAKTAGATLAEAGKINESLMYLGQCLQMQSDWQDGNKAGLVPFRQCKLTELLFSNSFPSSNQTSPTPTRHPQKALMIVTADPLGDFNATSQILRYSALAREVTVPRIPSVTESILSGSVSSGKAPSLSGRNSPNGVTLEELERATDEINRLTLENEKLTVKIANEEITRSELETRLHSMEERCLMIEQEVREECWAEMDERMEEERRRWQSAWDEQVGRNDEHMDKKIELVSRGFQIHEDPEPAVDERVADLEFENEQLLKKIAALERELTGRSPTKKSKPRNLNFDHDPFAKPPAIRRESEIENALRQMNQLKVADSMFSPTPAASSPGKKYRKMATRKWDLGPEENI